MSSVLKLHEERPQPSGSTRRPGAANPPFSHEPKRATSLRAAPERRRTKPKRAAATGRVENLVLVAPAAEQDDEVFGSSFDTEALIDPEFDELGYDPVTLIDFVTDGCAGRRPVSASAEFSDDWLGN